MSDLERFERDARRWRYTQKPGYFRTGPFSTDGDWIGYSVGIQLNPHSNLSSCVTGRGETLQEALDEVIDASKDEL